MWRQISDSIILIFPYLFITLGTAAFPIYFAGVLMSVMNEGIKRIVNSKRPDGSDSESFPSNHTSLSLLMAIMSGDIVVYFWSGLIAISRFKLRRHRLVDIIFGAIIAFFFFSFFVQKYLSFFYLV